MEIQVKLYRRVIYVFRKLLSQGSLVSSSLQKCGHLLQINSNGYVVCSLQSLKVEFPYISKFQFEDIEKTTGGRMSDVVVTNARREYNKYYTREIGLNECFNSFVYNYRLAYQGPNTAKAQIGAKLKMSHASRMKH